MGKTNERRDGGKLLSTELHAALRVNDEARRAAMMAGAVEPDFVPVAKLFSPVGAATWLATELGEDGARVRSSPPNRISAMLRVATSFRSRRAEADVGGAFRRHP